MLRLKFAYYLAIVLAVMLIQFNSQAQNPIVLQAHIPTQLQPIAAEEIADFEAQFGVQLVFHEDDTVPYLPSPAENLNAYLDALAAYAQSADVLLVHSATINPVGAKTGYLLDLAPLINSDASLNPDTFHQAAWQAYQWEGGFWAFPASFDTVMMAYNPSAFDAAGLSYPNETWGYAEYDFAIRNLGFESGYYDSYFFLSAPNDAYEIWQNLLEEGYIKPGESNLAGQVQSLSILPSSFFANSSAESAPLPDNIIGIETTGFAVSAGTAYPELAYELAKFLSNQNAVLQNIGQSYPAQNSLLDSTNIILMPEMPFIAHAIANNIAPDTAMLNAQNALGIAAERQANRITVTAPVSYGEGISLRFGVHTTIAPMPNQALWEDAAQLFAEQDNEVGAVVVEPNFSATLADTSSNYDCFLMQQGDMNAIDTSLLLPINPLLAQDASFNPDDLVGNLWELMQASGDIYGYPITIMPRYLALDTQAFSNAGLSINPDWTISEFTIALEALGGNAYQISDSLDLMVLLAAYDALPTKGDASFIESGAALAEILRLRNNGLLSYSSLLDSGMGTAPTNPIRPAVLSLDLPSNFDGFELVNYPSGMNYRIASYRLGVLYISRNTANPQPCYRWMRHLALHPEIFQSMPSHRAQLNEQFSAYETLLNQPNLVVLLWIAPVGNSDNFVLQYFYNEAADAVFLYNADISTALNAADAKVESYEQCRSTGQAPRDCATGLLPVELVWR